MNMLIKSLTAALALSAIALPVAADDLIATNGVGKGGMNTVALDLVTGGESVAFEFVVALPKGATNVDVSGCLKGMPASHQGKCVYNEKANQVIAIAFSASNEKLPTELNLGMVRYGSLQKGASAATIQDLVVADARGGSIPSEIRSENALLGK
jgi:hypothetical protein